MDKVHELKLLLVEDNLLNQEVALEMLDLMGHDVDLVVNGQEAVDAFNENSYDLIFMDCSMPVMDGYESARQIRLIEQDSGTDNHIPIVALTANAMSFDMEKCKQAGMDEFVSKPFSISDLKLAIERC